MFGVSELQEGGNKRHFLLRRNVAMGSVDVVAQATSVKPTIGRHVCLSVSGFDS